MWWGQKAEPLRNGCKRDTQSFGKYRAVVKKAMKVAKQDDLGAMG